MNRKTPSESYQNRKQTGENAERVAVQYLVAKGYRIIETNWRTNLGEIDIISRHGDLWVFVEVRSKSGKADQVSVLESIPKRKQSQVRKLVQLYLKLHPFVTIPPIRLDAILIQYEPGLQYPTILHFENAF